MLDPHLKDGVHEWRDGKRLIKEGVKVYIEGTNTLAGRCVLTLTAMPRTIEWFDCFKRAFEQCSDTGYMCAQFCELHWV